MYVRNYLFMHEFLCLFIFLFVFFILSHLSIMTLLNQVLHSIMWIVILLHAENLFWSHSPNRFFACYFHSIRSARCNFFKKKFSVFLRRLFSSKKNFFYKRSESECASAYVFKSRKYRLFDTTCLISISIIFH